MPVNYTGLVTRHEGGNAPDNVLTVHSLGDMGSGYFGNAAPRYMRNLILNYEKNRIALGLEDYFVSTEATHWSGSYGRNDEPGNPALLVQYPVPMVDIEVGSSPESWGNLSACTALARTLTEAFAVTHILANQWLVSEGYETETGIEAIFIHDKLKGCYKDLARNLAEKYDIPVYKHQKLRAPETLEWK